MTGANMEGQAIITQTDKLSFGRKIGFGLGGSASNFIWMMISFYMLYFYTDVFGIPASVAGFIFLGARIWDAVNDPIMGYIADRTNSRWGKFRPYLLFGSLPLALIYILTFTTPDLSPTGKIIYAVITYVLLGMLYTLVNIPYNSLAAAITQDTNERSSLASLMLITTYITVLIIAVATIPLVGLFPTQQAGFSYTVTIYAVFSMTLFLICFATTREKRSMAIKKPESFINHLKLISHNKYLLILALAMFFTSTANEIRTTAAIYFFKYNFGDESVFPVFMLVVAVFMIIGALMAPLLARKLESKRNLYILATLLSSITGLGILFTPIANLGTIILFSALGSVGGGMIFVLVWSMIPDTVEYGEWRTGVRGEGIVYSVLTFTTKMAYAAGGTLAAKLLSWAGFVPHVDQTAQVQNIILYMLALFPIIAGILAITVISFYKIDTKYHMNLVKEINERKNGQAVQTASPSIGAANV